MYVRIYFYIYKLKHDNYYGGGNLVKPFVFVPSNAYDNFKAAVLDKYAADETIQSNYSNKIVFIEQTKQLWVKGVFYDAGLPEIQKTLQADINTRLKQVASNDTAYLSVTTSNNIATLNLKKDAIHNYVVDNVWWDYTPPYIAGKNNNSDAFDININSKIVHITPDSTGVWSYDLSGVNITNANTMFINCKNLTSLDLSNFDTSQVNNMVYMFSNCKNLTSLDLNNFDTSQVNDMSYMFYSCDSLTSLDLSNFDTSQVNNMNYMFYGCRSLTSLDLSNFDMNKVTNIKGMFINCHSLKSIYVINCDEATVAKIKAAVTASGLSESIVKTTR